VQKMWQRQSKFNANFIREDASEQEKQAYTKDLIIHLEHELHEVLDETNWKMHKHSSNPVDLHMIREEVVDAFKYLLDIAITWGMTPEQFEHIFNEKSDFVEFRYEMEQKLEELRDGDRVCAVDIDGVLADYPAYWVDYVEKATGRVFDGETAWDRKACMEVEISPVMLSHLKDQYRRSGEERNVPLIDDYVPSFMRALKGAGYDVVAISARPAKRYHNLPGDTLYWMTHHGMNVDALFFDDEKHVTITKYVPKLKFIIEDEFPNALKVARSGYKVYLVDKDEKYDSISAPEWNENITIVRSLKEILNDLVKGGREKDGRKNYK